MRAQQADQARDGICRARTGPPLQQLLLLLGGSVDLLPGRALASPALSLATFDPSQNINTQDQWQHQSKEINVLLAVFTARPSSVKLCFKKVLGDVRAAFMSKSREPRRNGAMQTFTYYDALPTSHRRVAGRIL